MGIGFTIIFYFFYYFIHCFLEEHVILTTTVEERRPTIADGSPAAVRRDNHRERSELWVAARRLWAVRRLGFQPPACYRGKLAAASPRWARATRGLASQPLGVASPAQAPAARAPGAAAMAAAAALSSSSVRKNKEDSLGLSFMLGRDRPKKLGLSVFRKTTFFFKFGIFLN